MGKGKTVRTAMPTMALPQFDKDELFATANLGVDRVKAGEHLVPSELLARGLKDRRLLYAWHGLLRKQKDTLKNRDLARQVSSMQARQALLRPDDSDLDAAVPLNEQPIEARISYMTTRLRRKFEEMKVIEQARRCETKTKSALMSDLDWEDEAGVEGIAEANDGIENAIHRGESGRGVADDLHREEDLLKRKEQMMKNRDSKTNTCLAAEGDKIFRRQHTMRALEGTVQASSGVAPATDTSHCEMGNGLMVEALQDGTGSMVSNAVLPQAGSWARVLAMNLVTDEFAERYIPGCGRKRCAFHLGLADEVVEDKNETRTHAQTGLGLRWKEVGWFRPHEGQQVFNIMLIEALQHKTEFEPVEFARFGLMDLSSTSFVRGVDLKYYRPIPVAKGQKLSIDTALCSEQEEDASIMPFGSPLQRPNTVSGEIGRAGFMTPSTASPLISFASASAGRPQTSAGKY